MTLYVFGPYCVVSELCYDLGTILQSNHFMVYVIRGLLCMCDVLARWLL